MTIQVYNLINVKVDVNYVNLVECSVYYGIFRKLGFLSSDRIIAACLKTLNIFKTKQYHSKIICVFKLNIYKLYCCCYKPL